MNNLCPQKYAPIFSKFGPEQAEYYTHFLLSDPKANPKFWNKPEEWPGLYPFLRTQIRAINITAAEFVAGSTVVTKALAMVGGRNCVLMSRRATCMKVLTPLHTGAVLYQQDTSAGVQEIVPVTMQSIFNTTDDSNGNGYLSVPENWFGNETRSVTVTNGTGDVDAAVRMTFEVVTLIVGSNAQ